MKSAYIIKKNILIISVSIYLLVKQSLNLGVKYDKKICIMKFSLCDCRNTGSAI